MYIHDELTQAANMAPSFINKVSPFGPPRPTTVRHQRQRLPRSHQKSFLPVYIWMLPVLPVATTPRSPLPMRGPSVDLPEGTSIGGLFQCVA